ncbi:MAG: hypothetical protein WCN95_02655 [bacterium]
MSDKAREDALEVFETTGAVLEEIVKTSGWLQVLGLLEIVAQKGDDKEMRASFKKLREDRFGKNPKLD